jgi:tetratricopeptide (TPR) repeat protein
MTPKSFKILTGCLILLIPISGAIAVHTEKSQFNATSSTSNHLVGKTRETSQLGNSKQLASEPDSEGCPVCMEDGSDWSNRNLQNANFWSSSLKEANFSQSDLTGANFKDANLTGANFRNATLRNADFSKANLSHADLTGAQLQGANLQDAILFEAKLQNANLQGANLTSAVLPRGFNALNSSAVDSQSPESDATATDVQTVAREATVLIGDYSQGGSGVIIARSGNNYYVATAEHTIGKIEQYGLQTYDGEQHTFTANAVRKLPGVDLAILQFTSHKNYRIVRFVNSDLIGGIEATSVYIAGYPLSSDKQPRRYRFSSGRVMDNSPGDMAEGYSLFYTNTTLGGMSGGPILDRDGRLVGIHGRGFTEEMNDERGVLLPVQYELSLGIPINILLQLADQVGMNLPVQVERNASQSEQQTDLGLNPETSNFDTSRIRKVVRLCNQGFELLLGNQPQAALSAFSEAIELHPDSHLPWYGKAKALHSLGKMQDALAALDRTLQQEPSFYLALLAKGEILRELQQYPTAIAAYNQIIHEQNPLEPDVYSFFQSKAFYWRAATQYALRNTQSAIADYGEAIRLNPYFARAYYQRGSVYLELKNKPAAIQDFEQAANSYKAQGNMAGYHNTQQILSFLK